MVSNLLAQKLDQFHDILFVLLLIQFSHIVTSFFFCIFHHVYSNRKPRTKYTAEIQNQIRRGKESRSFENFTAAVAGDEDNQPPSCRCQGKLCPMRDAAVPVRRAAAELLSVNDRGERPPVPAKPPNLGRHRRRRRKRKKNSTNSWIRPPDPPPARIRRQNEELERRAGPRAPASRARGRRARRSSLAGEAHAGTKPHTSRPSS